MVFPSLRLVLLVLFSSCLFGYARSTLRPRPRQTPNIYVAQTRHVNPSASAHSSFRGTCATCVMCTVPAASRLGRVKRSVGIWVLGDRRRRSSLLPKGEGFAPAAATACRGCAGHRDGACEAMGAAPKPGVPRRAGRRRCVNGLGGRVGFVRLDLARGAGKLGMLGRGFSWLYAGG